MRRIGRVGLAGFVLGGGILGAACWKRSTPPPTIKAKPAARAPLESQASVAADAEVRLLDRIEPVGLGADAARLPPIGAATASATPPAPDSVVTGIGQFVSWAGSDPAAAAALPPELSRPYPEAIQPGALQAVSHGAGSIGPAPAATTTLFHEIRDGDTLAQLAQRYLGSSERYAEIYEANRDLLSHPDVLPLGAKLKVLVAREPAPAVDAPQADHLVPLGP